MDVGEGFNFSCTSIVFDVIKVRKRFQLMPLKAEFGFDWDRATGDRAPYARVQDRVFHGDFFLEPHRTRGTQVVYRKSIMSPYGNMNVRAGFLLKGLWDRRFSPFIGLSYDMGAGQSNVAQLTNGNGVDFRTQLPVSRWLRMEVCGNVKLPLPAAQYEEQEGNGTLGFGEGSVDLNIAQLNPVIYV